MTCGIYQLHSPSGKIYIGSSKNIERRVREHEKSAMAGKHRNPKLNAACAKYGPLEHSILFVCAEEELLIHEQRFIDELSPDYNCSSIAGKVEFLPEVRAKIGAAQKGRKHSEEHKAKNAAGNRGRKRSEETKARIGNSIKKTWRRQEYLEQQSAAAKERWSNPEFYTKQSAAAKERWLSPGLKEKHGAACKEGWLNSSEFSLTRLFPIVSENFRKPGTSGHRSLEIVLAQPGLRYFTFVKAGGKPRDLRHDVKKNRIRILLEDTCN